MTDPTREDLIKLGYFAALEGDLAQLRHDVGLTRNAQARLIGVDAEALRDWESLGRAMTLESALRIGEWYWGVKAALYDLSESGVTIHDLVPASVAAQHLGVTAEYIESEAGAMEFRHESVGDLGTFLYRTDLKRVARKGSRPQVGEQA